MRHSRRELLGGMLAGALTAASSDEPMALQPGAAPPLALLLASPWPSVSTDAAMPNDIGNLYSALRQRQFAPEQILRLNGSLRAPQVMSLLKEVGGRVRKQRISSLFLFYSGHGYYEGTTLAAAMPGLWLAQEEKLSWNTLFTTLDLPPWTNLTLLPDC